MKQLVKKADLRLGDYSFLDNPLISEEFSELMSKWITEWIFNKSNYQNSLSLKLDK
ncbi:hypothetical protein ABHC40_13450 [Turicibacter sanguinis]|uniref:hypothetical protein n=1 Tax=Turicibacter sanguinis TaxID=154288 RepID=UPI00325B7B9B